MWAVLELDMRRRGLSPVTISARLAVVAAFAAWLRPRPLSAATTEDVQRFLDSRRLGPQGRYTYTAHLHELYRAAIRAGAATHDPTVNVIRPHLPRRMPRPIGDGDLTMAVELAPRRMRCWLLLGAYAGMRRQEIAGLQRSDLLDGQDPPMMIVSRAKGSRERMVPINPHLWAALVAYGLPRTGYVFRNRRGQPLRPATVGDGIAEYLRGVGVDATAHRLRHSFGTAVYRRSLDLRLTQSLLGHASPTTTAVYAAFSPGAAVDVVNTLGAPPVMSG